MSLNGRVIEEQKNYFLVDTDQGVIRCQIRGSLKKNRTRVCSGDCVDVDVTNSDSKEGLITAIQERKSYLKRPALANLTRILFINTYRQPELDLESLDRFLFTAETYHIPAVIVFNKVDILESAEMAHLEKLADYYTSIGYQTIFTSAKTGHGLDEFKNICASHISACTGLSGVGKSTLLSCIFPDKTFRTAEVSGSAGRGTHTTTSIVLFPIDKGYIADTPGLSFVDIPRIDELDAMACFPELVNVIGQCRYKDCLHNGAPGCVVEELVDNGTILESRRRNFLKIYNELKNMRVKFR